MHLLRFLLRQLSAGDCPSLKKKNSDTLSVLRFFLSLLSLFINEGFVNVYRGTGTVLMAPTIKDNFISPQGSDSENSPSDSNAQKLGKALGTVGDILDLFS